MHYHVTMPDQPTWNDLLSSDVGGFTRPLTVHLPIHPLHSPDFIHVSPALHVCRRRVVPEMDAEDFARCREVAARETLLVQFALGSPPAVPDFRRSHLTLEEGRYPVATATYFEPEGFFYHFDYFCQPVRQPLQSILWITGSVTNEAPTQQTAQ